MHKSFFFSNNNTPFCLFSLRYRKEPIQRQQIHTQLEQSRHLRASLEDAAAKVEALSSSSSTSKSKSSCAQEAMNILQSSLPQIHQLETLTDALKEGGGYTTINGNNSDSSSENKTRKHREMENERQIREQQIIRQHLREFVRESNPTMVKIDEELKEHDDLSVDDDGMSNKSEGSTAIQFSPPSFSSGRAALPTSTMIKTFKRGSSYSSEDQTRKRSKNDLKRSKSSGSTRSDDGRLKVQEGKKNKKKKKSEKPAARKDPQVVLSASSATSMSRPPSSISNISNNSRTAPAKKPPPAVVPKKAPKPRSIKKCHDCKNSSNRQRVCNYWKLTGFTGAKCGKVFCLDCLTSKYSMGDDVRGPSKPDGKLTIEEIMSNTVLDSEWHCPSCLGICQCSVCVVHRNKEEEREKNRGDAERKSQRMTTAHSSYYNFF